jgi:hypothetical protein
MGTTLALDQWKENCHGPFKAVLRISEEARVLSTCEKMKEKKGDAFSARIIEPYLLPFNGTDHLEDSTAVCKSGFCAIDCIALAEASSDAGFSTSWCKETWSKPQRDELIGRILPIIPDNTDKSLDLRSKLMGMLASDESADIEYWLTAEEITQCLLALNMHNVYIWQYDEKSERYYHVFPHLTALEYRYYQNLVFYLSQLFIFH